MPQRTALYDEHRALGARMVEFGGWEMPVSYRGATEEHRAVRERCGVFDVSHMGEVELRGAGAIAFCDRLTVNAVARLGDGDGQYTVLCDDGGHVIDDLIVYRLAANRLLLVVNAANTAIDLEWIRRACPADVTVVDRSAETGLVALQGPMAEQVLRKLTTIEVPGIRPFTIRTGRVAGEDAFVARTGYTGEDGFELFVGTAGLVALWRAVVKGAEEVGGMPCGLAARDTLRLEAALALCGTDMDRTTTPLEAGLAWVVKLDKGDFIGRAALRAQRERGIPRRLVGIELAEAGIPRHGFEVWSGERRVGQVTSGTKSPTLGTCIGLAYVERGFEAPGTALAVDIRGRRVPARVVERPFYRRRR
ncbi:MAG TPA: glycine cleavage system aminomethyltransferase GcvT [Candidatus Eisenbacteria bacterium]|nr:glycine cleavage system aminomethyltransferase GcvT [Candidatus Eisenbacteria bacterium]